MSSGRANKCWFVKTRPLSSIMNPEPLPPSGTGLRIRPPFRREREKVEKREAEFASARRLHLLVLNFDKYYGRSDRIDDVGDRVWSAGGKRVHRLGAAGLMRPGKCYRRWRVRRWPPLA